LPAVPQSRVLRRLLLPLLAVALVATGLLIAGCGSSSSGNGGADPAKIAPKNSLVYLSAQVRPDGSNKEAVDSIAKKVLGVDDPGKRIQTLLDQSIKDEDPKSKINYEDDIAPWLGERAAVTVTSLGSSGNDAQAAGIFASKDNDKAKDFINQLGEEATPKAQSKSYEGTDYKVSEKTAVGLVDDYVVVGTEPGFKAVVDASKGDGLTDNSQFTDAAKGNEDKLGFGWVDTKSLLDALGASGQLPGGSSSLQGVIGAAGQPVSLSLAATASKITLEAVAAATGSPLAKQSELLPDLPGDSWLAFGIPGLGQAIKKSLDQLGGGVGAGIVQTASSQVKAATGLDLEKDILPTFGELAGFVRGEGILTVGGGVVIKPQDPAAARRVLAKAPALIRRLGASNGVKVGAASIGGATGVRVTFPDVPGSIDAVLKGDRLVIAYTDAATREALAPKSTLGDSQDYQSATASLDGAVPALFMSFPPVAALAAAASPESASQIKQYLGAFSTLAAGTTASGNKQTGRFVLNLK
jgi:Protein of unknown function (DUF3352)